MTSEDVNRYLRDTSRAFPNKFESKEMLPKVEAALEYARAWQPRAVKAGLAKTMAARIKRLEDVRGNLKINAPNTFIENGKGGSWVYVFQAIVGPYIESAGILGDEDVKRKAWDGLIEDLKSFRGLKDLADEARKGLDEARKGLFAIPWKPIGVGLALVLGYGLYSRVRGPGN